jgi:deoxyribonuclease-4
MSVAGGLPRAVERAVVHGCEALQVFAKNASQWRGRVLPASEILEFRDRVKRSGVSPVVSHGSYLINLASANAGLRRQSLDAMADELARAEALGLLGVVLHPGCYTDGSEEHGLALVSEALVELLRQRPRSRAMILIEGTAGQGTSLGATFEQIAAMLEGAGGHKRLGVCLDTCHLLAAGYDLLSPEGYARTFRDFDRLIGFDRLKVFHVNDSKRPLGSRVDRHAHIGEGHLGLEPFRRLINDRRFRDLPMLLETPKGEGRPTGAIVADPLDVRNLATLRSLIAPRTPRPRT